MNAFTWRVEANGYEWAEHRGQAFLHHRVVPMSGGGSRLYTPGPALFREFAGTDPTPEGTLLFANRFGELLGPERFALDSGGPHPDPGVFALPVIGHDGDYEVQYRETWGLWHEEVNALNRAVRLWETGEGAGLPDLINGGLAGRAAPRFVRDPRTGKLALQVVPENLLGAMWLQLAEAIGGGKQFRQCDRCGAWFEVSGRVDRKLCSDACRSAAYRARQERARQLAAEGKGLSAIARELGSDVKTVRRWVAGR
jgi:hypothetical protein